MLESARGLENESACATSMLLGRLANDLAASDWKTRPRSRSRLSLRACWSKAVLLSGGMGYGLGERRGSVTGCHGDRSTSLAINVRPALQTHSVPSTERPGDQNCAVSFFTVGFLLNVVVLPLQFVFVPKIWDQK